jgi:CubicO group peptidase (beta-lactamase class C family)
MEPEAIFAAVEEADRERYGVSALSVGVLSGTASVRGFGASGDATFRIASITKPLVAATAMRLVEEGRLALDEPVTGLRLPWEGITLRHLLSHQAGLAHDWQRPLADYGEADDALQRLAADEAVGSPVGPGRYFSYANPGYWLTGALIERAAEMPFEEALRRLVLEPLGMERTGFGPVEPSVPSDIPYPQARRPSGGLYSCAADGLAFAAHLLGGPGPLGAESLRELQTPQIEVGPDGNYGLGLGVWRGRGKLTIEHGGAVDGVRTQLLVVPEDGSAFVLLTNSNRGHFLINRLLRSVGLALPLPPEVAVGDEELERLAGTFREPLGTTIRVAPREGGIDLASSGDGSSHLRPASPTRFVVREGDEKGAWAEFFEHGGLLRYDTLYERVG